MSTADPVVTPASSASSGGPVTLATLSALAETVVNIREAAALLRERIAPGRVIVVDAMDMRQEAPAISGARWNLFLAASDGHCWTVTREPAQAAGLYISPRS